jgi:hypothetical protein
MPATVARAGRGGLYQAHRCSLSLAAIGVSSRCPPRHTVSERASPSVSGRFIVQGNARCDATHTHTRARVMQPGPEAASQAASQPGGAWTLSLSLCVGLSYHYQLLPPTTGQVANNQAISGTPRVMCAPRMCIVSRGMSFLASSNAFCTTLSAEGRRGEGPAQRPSLTSVQCSAVQ